MNNELQIYRKRLIPEECILLKDDIIVEQNDDYILTKWKTLNPKTTFSHGCSCYYLKEGFKISKFYRHDGSLLYWYCDIVEYTRRPEENALIVTDLLADIILYPDGRMHVVDLDELAKEVDFFSVGTNDLTQYTLAIDRQNTKLDEFYDAHHPAVLRMISMVAENAHKAGIWAGICGELGADTTLTQEFLAMGIDELSVSPGSILPIRKIVLETNVTDYKKRKAE